MKEITNLSTRALPLEDGTILAAAGTAGCVKQVESLSDAEAQRLSVSIFIREVEFAGKEPPIRKGPAATVSVEDQK